MARPPTGWNRSPTNNTKPDLRPKRKTLMSKVGFIRPYAGAFSMHNVFSMQSLMPVG
jgi:hypothetical protein